MKRVLQSTIYELVVNVANVVNVVALLVRQIHEVQSYDSYASWAIAEMCVNVVYVIDLLVRIWAYSKAG